MSSSLGDVHNTDPDTGLIDALAQTAYTVTAALSKVGAEHDLSLSQMRLLGILRDRRLRMAALAEYLGLDKSTMSGLVDRAEKRGLIARAPSAIDGRAVEVSTTPQGEALMAPVYGRFVELLAPLTGRLSPAERRHLQALLERALGSTPP